MPADGPAPSQVGSRSRRSFSIMCHATSPMPSMPPCLHASPPAISPVTSMTTHPPTHLSEAGSGICVDCAERGTDGLPAGNATSSPNNCSRTHQTNRLINWYPWVERRFGLVTMMEQAQRVMVPLSWWWWWSMLCCFAAGHLWWCGLSVGLRACGCARASICICCICFPQSDSERCCLLSHLGPGAGVLFTSSCLGSSCPHRWVWLVRLVS